MITPQNKSLTAFQTHSRQQKKQNKTPITTTKKLPAHILNHIKHKNKLRRYHQRSGQTHTHTKTQTNQLQFEIKTLIKEFNDTNREKHLIIWITIHYKISVCLKTVFKVMTAFISQETPLIDPIDKANALGTSFATNMSPNPLPTNLRPNPKPINKIKNSNRRVRMYTRY